MRITALKVDGFGVWTGLELDGLSAGLNVFYGPNEAGKTTLLQFVRSMLYGFSPLRRRYLPPLYGGTSGGALRMSAPGGRYELRRSIPSRDLNAAEQMALVTADGARQGEHLLKVLLSNIDETIFNNVFAVGLRELQELGTLSDTEASKLLYSLSIGLDRVSLMEVTRELGNSRRRLLDPDGGPCKILELLGQREQLTREIQELGTLTRRYGRLAAENDQIHTELEQLEVESTRLQRETRVVEAALAVRDRWHKRRSLDEELTVMGPVELTDDIVERFEAVAGQISQRQAQKAALGRELDRLRAALRGLKVNEVLWRMAPRVEALKDQSEWLGTLQSRIGEVELEIAELESQLNAEQQRLGLADAGNDLFSSLTSRALASLRPPAIALRHARSRLEKAQGDVATGRESSESFRRQIDAALEARGESSLAKAIERTGSLVTQLRRRVQLDERLEQMDRYHGELEDQSRDFLDRQLLPMWVLVALGGVFIVGVVAAMAGLFMPESIVGSAGWALLPLGLFGTVSSIAAKFLLERANARRLDGCQKQLSMLQHQIKQARDERDALDRQLPRGGGPIISRLHAAEQELAELEELVPLDAQLKASEQEGQSADARLRQAEKELAAAERQWQESLTTAGLPRKLTPKQVRQVAVRYEELGDVRRRLEVRYEECQQRTRELDGLTGRIAHLAAEVGLRVADKPPADQLRVLYEELRQQESRLKDRDDQRKQYHRLRRKAAHCEDDLRRLRARRRSLLRSCGVADEPELRRQAAALADVRRLRQDRDALNREIEAAVAGHCTAAEIADLLDGPAPAHLESRRDELSERCRAIERQQHERLERRGRLAEQMLALADDRTPAVKQLELALVEKRLEEASAEWRKLALTSKLLHSIRKTYERDRQPEALEEASGYLKRMTRGRYTRVWTPLDEDVLFVDDEKGRTLSVELLSQGVREQLFVSLRLALAGLYARRGATLPLILDDVLVNFDTERARAAACVLRDFAAAGHQVLVFTCHEHIARLFKDLDVDVVDLPGNSTPAIRALPSETSDLPRRKKRLKRPVTRPVVAPPAPVYEIETEPEPEREPEPEPEPPEPEPEPEPVAEPELELEPEPDELPADRDFAPVHHEIAPWEDLVPAFDDFADDGLDLPAPEPPPELLEAEDDDPEEIEEPAKAAEPEPVETLDEIAYEDDEELDEDDEESDDDGGHGRRRRPRDDWDDRYEDEYDYLEEEFETHGDFDAEAA